MQDIMFAWLCRTKVRMFCRTNLGDWPLGSHFLGMIFWMHTDHLDLNTRDRRSCLSVTMILLLGTGFAKRLRASKGYSSVVKFKQDVAWEEEQDAFFRSALKPLSLGGDLCIPHQLHDLAMEDDALQMLADIFSEVTPYSAQESFGSHEDV